MLKKNDLITLTIEKLSHEGQGIAFLAIETPPQKNAKALEENDQEKIIPCYIENALPTEKVEVKILRIEKKRAFGKVQKFLTTSAKRQDILSPQGFQTGTLTLQHLNYESQLAFKKEQVEYLMRSIAKMPKVEVKDVLPSPQTLHYRNKAQIPFRMHQGTLTYGFFRKNSHQLIPMQNFYLHDPEIDKLLAKIAQLCQHYAIEAYNEEKHQGNLRHIILRRSERTKQIMLIFVTKEEQLLSAKHSSQTQDAFLKELLALNKEIVSVVQNIHSKASNVILGEKSKILYGQDSYTEKLCDFTFHISSKSFFQVNTEQAERLYAEVLKAAQLKGTEKVIDAYCGIGSISLCLAKQSAFVYALEIVPEAIENAKKNALHNAVENVSFEVGDAKILLPQWKKDGLQADVIVVDPPRKGLDLAFIDASVAMGANRVVYVSCNPATMARDVALYAERGYHVEYVQPVDMFPQTEHVECVALMSKDVPTK